MSVREWALVTFTILAQMSVGAFVVLGIVHSYANRKAGMQEADRLSDRALVAIIITLGLGMLASLLHLGNPLRAPTAVTNLATSWLSREILSGVAFAVLGVIFAAMQWFKWGTYSVRNVIAWIAAAVGLVLVYCMSRVYMIPEQPAWNTIVTPLSFYIATLMLGVLALGAAFVANYAYLRSRNPEAVTAQLELLRTSLKGFAITSIVLVGLQLVMLPLYMGYLATGPAAAVQSVSMMIGPFGVMYFLRLALAFLGAGVFGVFLYIAAGQPGKERTMSSLAYGAFALVLVAEVLGRLVFYSTQRGIGL
jgi:anaerobic dimethyl sulfoxide reductase subunit C (anchor subunit)